MKKEKAKIKSTNRYPVAKSQRIDIVLQATGQHSWNLMHGWQNAAKDLGMFHRLFTPLSTWGDIEPQNDDGLFKYLENPQADYIMLLGFDWHSQMLHSSFRWKDRWKNARIKKILYVHESLEDNCILSGNNLMKKTAISAAECVDVIIYNDPTDKLFFESIHPNAVWMPYGSDESVFYSKTDFLQRKNRAFFRGKTIPYNTNRTYQRRRELLEYMVNHDAIDFLQYTDKRIGIEGIVQDYNDYRFSINLPTLGHNHPSRVTEGMSCGCVMVTNRTHAPLNDDVFIDREHVLYYSDEKELLSCVLELTDDPIFAQKVAQQGHEFVHDNLTLPHLLTNIIEKANASNSTRKPNVVEFGTKSSIDLSTPKPPQIIVDGVIFQIQEGRPLGISRVWYSILSKLAATDLGGKILLLDRGNTAMEIVGIRKRVINSYNFKNFEEESCYLQSICDEENASIFLSTYYTYPEFTPSILMIHDMIPEVLGMDLNELQWRAKNRAIQKAYQYYCVSNSTKNDFQKIYPQYEDRKVTLTPNAVSEVFRPHQPHEIEEFKKRFNITKPYFMITGMRILYKNVILFFRALDLLPNKDEFEVICTGGGKELEPQFKQFLRDIQCRVIFLSDEDLSTAYSGAVALVYPSQYEGFGLPILEAQQSACPVITCRNSSIPEVTGDSVLYVDKIDVKSMFTALQWVQAPAFRNQLISDGQKNVRRFSWDRTAEIIYHSFIQSMDELKQHPYICKEPIATIGHLICHITKYFPGEIELAYQIINLYNLFFTNQMDDSAAFRSVEDKVGKGLARIQDQLLPELAPFSHCDSLVVFCMGLSLEERASDIEALGAYIISLKNAPDEWNISYKIRIAIHSARLSSKQGNHQIAKKFLVEIVLNHQPDNREAISCLRDIEKAEKSTAFSPQLPDNDHKKSITSETTQNQESHPILVSAIVSTYNSEKYIRKLIEDIESQTIADQTEIIIVDSGSRQNEEKIIHEYSKRNGKIKYIRSQKRETIYQAWNRAIEVANGKYITNANTDDRHHPEAYQRMVKVLESNPDIGVVYHDSAITNLPNTRLEYGPITGRLRWPDFTRRQLFQTCIIGPQPMWRKSLHDQYGLFDPNLTIAGDYEFWLRISEKTKFYHIPDILGLYYESDSSLEHRYADNAAAESITVRGKHWKQEKEPLPANNIQYLERYTSDAFSGNETGFALVSVIIPTYNRPKELSNALASIRDQTYPNIEVIVINDGGRDVQDVIHRYEGTLDIHYVNLTINKGTSTARNHGLRMAKGKYVCFLDDDDKFYPEHICVLVSELDNNPSLTCAYSDANQVTQTKSGKLDRRVFFSHDFSEDELLVHNFIPILCTAIRRETITLCGDFDENLIALEDWEWLIRLSRSGMFNHIPVVTSEYVVRTDSKSRNILLPEQIRSIYKTIYCRYSKPVMDTVLLQNRANFYMDLTGRKLEQDIPELFNIPTEQKRDPVNLLQEILSADDILEELRKHEAELDENLLQLVINNVDIARQNDEDELAEGLDALAEYIRDILSRS